MQNLADSPYRALPRPNSVPPDWTVEHVAITRLNALQQHGRAASLPLFQPTPGTTSGKTPPHMPIAGVDEAGRGPLAGPVVAAAVVLNPDALPDGLHDSKKLAPQKREALFEAIMANHCVSIASASPKDIDARNILQANLAAMASAVSGLARPPAAVMIDGRDIPKHLPCPGLAVIKGDALSLSIAAASIVAKVMRDRMMQICDTDAPGYGFAQNKGYGSEAHRAVIVTRGGSRHHRKSFAPLREMLEKNTLDDRGHQ